MTVLTDRLAYPNLRKVFLLEVTAGEHLTFWTVDAGSVYYATTAQRIVDVKENGVSLVEGSSTSLSAGEWYWDQAAGRVYVCCTGSVSPYTKTIQAMCGFYFSTEPRIYNGLYYEPIIKSLPTLSLRVEETFGGPGQLGAGSVVLNNEGGYFDSLTGLQWDAGVASLKLGVDDPKLSPGSSFYQQRTGDFLFVDSGGDSFVDDAGGAWVDSFGVGILEPLPVHSLAAYSDFDTIGAFRIRSWEKDDESFSLKLEEPKAVLKKKIPVALFDRATYPNIADDMIGEPIPVGYGELYDVEAIPIDPSTRTFKVVGHAIRAFDAVRVEDTTNDVWISAAFGSPNLTDSTFTLTEAEWDGKAQVAVDFKGKALSAGVLMDNASDVVKDLLTVELGIGSSEIDATTFAESNTRLEVGTDRYGKQYNHRRVGVYLDEPVEASKVIEAINAAVGSYLFSDHTGLFRYIVFEPEPGDGLTTFDESSIFSFEEEVESKDVISQVRGKYREDRIAERWQSYVRENAAAQYLKGDATAITDEREWPAYREGDAQYITQRTARMEGDRLRTWRMKVSHIGCPLLPGAFVKVEYDRHGMNDVMEVLEVKRSIPSMSVELRLGNLHALRDESGFWVADSPTFPASLGGGSCAAWSSGWTAAQKDWARQNIGYWTDDNGFADSADPDSFMPSAWM